MAHIRMGLIGCGAIAQVHHLPNLIDLSDLFTVVGVCDVSHGAADYVARKFRIPHATTNHRELLAMDVDAVLLCQSDPKTQVAVEAFAAGKHVFIEKPMCFSLQEVDRLVDACRQAGTVGQVGYMKLYDPAYEIGQREVASMDSIRFVQVNHLHPNNDLHMRQFDVRRFGDVPAEATASTEAARKAAVFQAIGDVSPAVMQAFHLLSGSMIHDLYGMRTMFGMPSQIVCSEIWLEGRAFSMTLAYPNGARCVASWVDLPALWDFKETLEVYGDNKRVIVSYPTGFARGILSTVTVQGIDRDGVSYRREPAVAWESAFVRELRHFHACIRDGVPCRTPVSSARADVAFIIDVIKAYQAQVNQRM